MRGKERARAQAGVVVDVLDHRPGNREAVVGACAAADFVQYEQAAVGGVVQNVGCFHHFHHKGGLAAMNLVARTETREDAIHHADLRRVGGHKGAHLRQQHNQRGLAQVGALAAHVGSGDDLDGAFGAQMRVVGHEGTFGHPEFHHGVASAHNLDGRPLVHLRTHVATLQRHLSKG